VVHRERLAVAYPVFDADTLANRALHQALHRVRATTSDDTRRASTNALLGAFPEVGAQRVRPEDFARLQTSRRAESYAEALELARLLLAVERPDLHWGGAPVISLLFDMNALFEGYVLRQLRRIDDLAVHATTPAAMPRGEEQEDGFRTPPGATTLAPVLESLQRDVTDTPHLADIVATMEVLAERDPQQRDLSDRPSKRRRARPRAGP